MNFIEVEIYLEDGRIKSKVLLDVTSIAAIDFPLSGSNLYAIHVKSCPKPYYIDESAYSAIKSYSVVAKMKKR